MGDSSFQLSVMNHSFTTKNYFIEMTKHSIGSCVVISCMSQSALIHGVMPFFSFSFSVKMTTLKLAEPNELVGLKISPSPSLSLSHPSD